MNDLLPVGSIVRIRFDQAKYCVIGFYAKGPTTEKLYDYLVVKYPAGLDNFDNVAVLDNNRIKEVVQRGYETEEDQIFRQAIYDEIKGEHKGEQIKNIITPVVQPIEKLEGIERLDEIEKLDE